MAPPKFNIQEIVVGDYTVFIGKDAYSNDYLSLKRSHANDLWFHAKGVPGSHIVISCHDSLMQPEKEVLQKVASLAGYYSKHKNARRVTVIYTQCKNVRKGRGAAPGSVMVSKEKTIQAVPKSMKEIDQE